MLPENLDSTDRKLFVMPFVIGVCAALLSLRVLPELDFGWHLATGTWIFSNASMVYVDPFGAGRGEWIAYSWLFDLLLAQIYNIAGYPGLQLLQAVAIALLFFLALVVYRCIAKPGSLSEIAALFLLMILSSPFLYLRPQLFSAIFGVVLIGLMQNGGTRIWPFLVLGVVWANVHVYWIAVPGLLFLEALSHRSKGLFVAALMSCFCGLATPYGVEVYGVLYDYAFAHDYALPTITEFQPLSIEHGLYFFAALFNALVLIALLCRYWRCLSFACCLFIFLGVISPFLQIKYLLLSAVASFWTIMSIGKNEKHMEGSTQYSVLAFVISYVLTFFLTSLAGAIPPPRSQQQVNLQRLVSQIPHDAAGVVLNHFDTGGALAWYLFDRRSNLRTSIDGRTLVMGKTRIKQWVSLANDEEEFCEVLEMWKPDIAILRKGSRIGLNLREKECSKTWLLHHQCGDWQLLVSQQKASRYESMSQVCGRDG